MKNTSLVSFVGHVCFIKFYVYQTIIYGQYVVILPVTPSTNLLPFSLKKIFYLGDKCIIKRISLSL